MVVADRHRCLTRVVAAHHAGQPVALDAYRRVHSSPRLRSEFLELAHQAPAIGTPLDHEPSIETPRTVVREPEEVEGLAASGAALFAQFARKVAELDEARLPLVECKLELR
jgi:hypothetical protein